MAETETNERKLGMESQLLNRRAQRYADCALFEQELGAIRRRFVV